MPIYIDPKTGQAFNSHPETGKPLYRHEDHDESAYFQPRKWNHPKVKKEFLENKEITQYQDDYTKKEGEKEIKNPGRLVHDNLINGGPKTKVNTHYKNEFRPKSAHDYKPDRDMFHINRDFVRNAKPVNTQYPIKAKNTEYTR